jgi:NADH:ubiquinone oxidoreductase subunit E
VNDLDPKQAATIRGLAAAYAAEPGAPLPMLHAIEDGRGVIPGDAVAIVADALDLPRADSAVTFDHVAPERHERISSAP